MIYRDHQDASVWRSDIIPCSSFVESLWVQDGNLSRVDCFYANFGRSSRARSRHRTVCRIYQKFYQPGFRENRTHCAIIPDCSDCIKKKQFHFFGTSQPFISLKNEGFIFFFNFILNEKMKLLKNGSKNH